MTINIFDLIIILISHFIGDFIFQSRVMANNKHDNIFWLLTHGLFYGISLFVIIYGVNCFKYPISLVLGYSLLNTIIHVCVDFVSSKFTSKHYKNDEMYNMFCIIGFDQMVHTIILVLTFLWLF